MLSKYILIFAFFGVQVSWAMIEHDVYLHGHTETILASDIHSNSTSSHYETHVNIHQDVSTEIFQDVDYEKVCIAAKMTIGSNKQEFKVLLDTGSMMFWVPSIFCSDCPSQAKFDDRQSSTFSFYDIVLDLHYGSGDVYGYASNDEVCLADS